MEDEKLIDLVRQYEFLYNSKHSKYMDTPRKELAWKEISKQLNQSVATCKQRWQTLRDAFRRTLKRRKGKTGLIGKNIKKWKYESEMAFVAPFFMERKGHDSTEFTGDDEDSEIESIEPDSDHLNDSSDKPNTDIPSIAAVDVDDYYSSDISEGDKRNAGRISKRKKIKLEQSECAALMAKLDNRSIESRGHDELDRFFLNISDTVKKFPPYQQALAKNQIFSIVSEMELQQLAPSSSISTVKRRLD